MLSLPAILTAIGLIGPLIEVIGDSYTALRPMLADLLRLISGHPDATPEQKAEARALLDLSMDEALARLDKLGAVPPPTAPR